MEAPLVGGHRPEGAVAPYMDKMEGWLDRNVSLLLIISTKKSSSGQNPYSLLSKQSSLND
jgi:hypothetical protein